MNLGQADLKDRFTSQRYDFHVRPHGPLVVRLALFVESQDLLGELEAILQEANPHIPVYPNPYGSIKIRPPLRCLSEEGVLL